MTCQNIFGKEQAIMDLIKIVFQVFVKYHFKLFFFQLEIRLWYTNRCILFFFFFFF